MLVYATQIFFLGTHCERRRRPYIMSALGVYGRTLYTHTCMDTSYAAAPKRLYTDSINEGQILCCSDATAIK